MMLAKQPVSLDGIEFDALVEINDTLESDAPEYPTEEGFSVNDTIIIKPRHINLTVYLSNTPVTWKERFGSSTNRVNEVKQKLLKLYMERKTVTLITTNDVYKDYCITSISFPRNIDNGCNMEIPITLKEIRKTSTKTTKIPDSYKRAGQTKKNAGTVTTGSSKGIASNGNSNGNGNGNSSDAKTESKKNASILYGIANGTGLDRFFK